MVEMRKFLDESASSEYTLVSSGGRLDKIILVCADAGKSEVCAGVVEMIVEKLVDCNKYAYASAEKVEKCLTVLCHMLGCVKGKHIENKLFIRSEVLIFLGFNRCLKIIFNAE